MKITLHESDVCTFILLADNGRSILVQSGDLPDLATIFGWSPCSCGSTDGTVDCDHRSACEMIADARDFLRAHAGDTTDDPGYF